MNEQRLCLDCGEVLHGRVDKKFCDDQCRSNFNNRLYSETNTHVRQINNILRRNRKILEELNPTGKTKVSKKKMINKGFDFSYLTSFYKTNSGKTRYFCYEHGYLFLDRDELLLVKREDHG
jgi:hypothetical protein